MSVACGPAQVHKETPRPISPYVYQQICFVAASNKQTPKTQSRSSVWPRLTSTARQAVGRDWPGVQSPPQFGGFGNFSQIGPTPVFSKKSQRCLVQAKTIPSQKSDGTCHDPRAHLAIEAVGALPDMVLARASVRLLARPETWKKKKNGTAQTESLKTMKKGTPSAEPSV